MTVLKAVDLTKTFVGGDGGLLTVLDGLSLQVDKKPEEEESTGPLVVNIKKPEPKPAAAAAVNPPAAPAPAPAARPPSMELSLEEKPAPPQPKA